MRFKLLQASLYNILSSALLSIFLTPFTQALSPERRFEMYFLVESGQYAEALRRSTLYCEQNNDKDMCSYMAWTLLDSRAGPINVEKAFPILEQECQEQDKTMDCALDDVYLMMGGIDKIKKVLARRPTICVEACSSADELASILNLAKGFLDLQTVTSTQAACESGDGRSCLVAGAFYVAGLNTPRHIGFGIEPLKGKIHGVAMSTSSPPDDWATALTLFTRGCQKKSLESCWAAARMRLLGWGAPFSSEAALPFLKASCTGGLKVSCVDYAFTLDSTLMENDDESKQKIVRYYYRSACQQDYKEACGKLGLYPHGADENEIISDKKLAVEKCTNSAAFYCQELQFKLYKANINKEWGDKIKAFNVRRAARRETGEVWLGKSITLDAQQQETACWAFTEYGFLALAAYAEELGTTIQQSYSNISCGGSDNLDLLRYRIKSFNRQSLLRSDIAAMILHFKRDIQQPELLPYIFNAPYTPQPAAKLYPSNSILDAVAQLSQLKEDIPGGTVKDMLEHYAKTRVEILSPGEIEDYHKIVSLIVKYGAK